MHPLSRERQNERGWEPGKGFTGEDAMLGRFGKLAVATLLCLAGAVPTAAAETQQDLDWCNGKGEASAEQKVAGCTALIQSGNYSGNNLAIVYFLRGRAQKDQDKQLADYAAALKLNPAHVGALSNRALVYRARKQYDLALGDLAKAIAAAPQEATPWAYQGDVYHAMGSEEAAITSFTEAIKRAPEWMWPYTDRGELYLERGDHALAIKDFDASIKFAPTYAMGWNNRCRAYAITGELDKALADCNQALKIKPDFVNSMQKTGRVSARQDRALVHLKAGRFGDAIQDYDLALVLLPQSAEVLYGRGLAKTRAGDKAGGEADIKAAMALQADIAERFKGYGVK